MFLTSSCISSAYKLISLTLCIIFSYFFLNICGNNVNFSFFFSFLFFGGGAILFVCIFSFFLDTSTRTLFLQTTLSFLNIYMKLYLLFYLFLHYFLSPLPLFFTLGLFCCSFSNFLEWLLSSLILSLLFPA